MDLRLSEEIAPWNEIFFFPSSIYLQWWRRADKVNRFQRKVSGTQSQHSACLRLREDPCEKCALAVLWDRGLSLSSRLSSCSFGSSYFLEWRTPLTTDISGIFGFVVHCKFPLLELTLWFWQSCLCFRGSLVSVGKIAFSFVMCVAATCQSVIKSSHLSRGKYRWRSGWQKLCGASMPSCVEGSSRSAITTSFMCLPFPFCRKIKKKKKSRGATGEEHKAWQSRGHRLLIHNSIIVGKVFLCSNPETGVCWRAQKKLLFSCLRKIGIWITVCMAIWTFAFLCSWEKKIACNSPCYMSFCNDVKQRKLSLERFLLVFLELSLLIADVVWLDIRP